MNRATSIIVACLFAACYVAAWAAVPHDGVVRDRCDVIEVNHYFADDGRLVFDQEIFYEWNKLAAHMDVIGWRLIKHPSQLPQRDRLSGGYIVTWQDGEIMRVIRSSAVKESWLQHDPELCERDIVPKERRKELTPAVVRRCK